MGISRHHGTQGTSDCDAVCEAQADSVFERFQIEMATTSPTIGAEDWTETDSETGHVVRFITYAAADQPATAHTQYVDNALAADARYTWEPVSGGWLLKQHTITGYYEGQETWKASAEFYDGPPAYSLAARHGRFRSLASSLRVGSSCVAARVFEAILPTVAWAQEACDAERRERIRKGISFAVAAGLFGFKPNPVTAYGLWDRYENFWSANRRYYECLRGGSTNEPPVKQT
ncbi:hypothetical protein BH23GEM1_BH23GEM1_08080 [soil metagenome]